MKITAIERTVRLPAADACWDNAVRTFLKLLLLFAVLPSVASPVCPAMGRLLRGVLQQRCRRRGEIGWSATGRSPRQRDRLPLRDGN